MSVGIHNILKEDAIKFEEDWNIIINKIKNVMTDKLSESDTKGVTAKK